MIPSSIREFNDINLKIQEFFHKVFEIEGDSAQNIVAQVIKDHLGWLEIEIRKVRVKISSMLEKSSYLQPQEIKAFEDELHYLTRKLNDLISANVVQHAIARSEVKKQGRELIKNGKSCTDKGLKRVFVTFSGGNEIEIYTTYYLRKGAGGRKGKGYYPELLLLGIYFNFTASLLSKIIEAGVALGSYQEAVRILKQQGIRVSGKRVMSLVRKFSTSARLSQDSIMHTFFPEGLKKKQVVISIDGGRVRVRKRKRGPKTKKKRHHYHTEWREPKLFIVYIAEEGGKINRQYLPIIDGIIANADAIFNLLYRYLRKLKLEEAGDVLFIADGATWIWERILPLEEKLKHAGVICKFLQLIDFFHAVQHLSDFAKCKVKWTSKERKRWVNKQKKRLKEGGITQVLEAMKEAMKGSRQKGLKKDYNYFFKNKERMVYSQIAALNLPIGSGAIESSIRRVVNLRMKSPCVFWNEDGANAMIMLRSYFKAKQWKILTQAVHNGELMKLAA